MKRSSHFSNRKPTIAQQIIRMKQLFPFLPYRREKGRFPTWRGILQPTDGSPEYRVKIVAKEKKVPRVWITAPTIRPHAPHRYGDKSLCLFYPGDGNWNRSSWIAETIVPWTAEWLLFYELWVETGKWWGPEAPHKGKKRYNRN